MASSPPGAYPIVAAGLSSSNYAIAFVDGVYQVLSASFVPSFFATQLTQRDLRLLIPAAGGDSCQLGSGGASSFARWVDRPFRTEPDCASFAAKGAR